MNRNIPLVQDNSVNSINTSLCAINRAMGQNGVPEVNVNVNYNVTDEVSADNIYPVTSRGVKAALDDLDETVTEHSTITTSSDSTPYSQRVNADKDKSFINKLIGASFAINQLVKNGNFASTSNWTTSGATLTVSGKVASIVTSNNYGSIYQALNMQSGHKYLISVDIKATTANQSVRVLLADNNTENPIYLKANSTTSYVTYQGVVTSSTTKYLFIGSNGTQTTVNARNAFFIDLTQMFGSAIADRIYAMEQATEGSGVAWIKSFGFFNNTYYSTDEGSIQSVKPSAYKTTGFNKVRDFTAVGATTQFQAVLYADCNLRPYTRYCIGLKAPAGISLYFNEYIFKRVGAASNSFQTTGNYQYFIVDTLVLNIANHIDGLGWIILKTYNASASTANITDVCVSLADSRFDGQYEKYIGEWNYPLANTELRGIPKLDSNNNLIFDGDVYYPNGDVIRRYASLTNQSGAVGATITLTGYKTNGNIICSKGAISNIGTISGTTLTLTSAISNETIIYELATPTSETVAGYSNPHTLIRKGAEEFVDTRTIALPVGHETEYAQLPDWLCDNIIFL